MATGGLSSVPGRSKDDIPAAKSAAGVHRSPSASMTSTTASVTAHSCFDSGCRLVDRFRHALVVSSRSAGFSASSAMHSRIRAFQCTHLHGISMLSSYEQHNFASHVDGRFVVLGSEQDAFVFFPFLPPRLSCCVRDGQPFDIHGPTSLSVPRKTRRGGARCARASSKSKEMDAMAADQSTTQAGEKKLPWCGSTWRGPWEFLLFVRQEADVCEVWWRGTDGNR